MKDVTAVANTPSGGALMATQKTIRSDLATIESALDRRFDSPVTLLYDKPQDGSWSIAENLEHVSLTNHFLLKIIRRHVAKALERAAAGVEVADQNVTDRLEAVQEIRHRASFNWTHPKHMTPTGSADLSKVRLELKAQFDECKEFLNSMRDGEGYLVKVNMTVNNLGKLNMYEWIYFLVQHAMRHEDKLFSTVDLLGQLTMPERVGSVDNRASNR